MSTHAILTLATGRARVNYRQRAAFDRDVESALQALHANAVTFYGEVHAACVLAHVLAKAPPTPQGVKGRTTGVDGAYRPRPWAVAILKQHHVAIAEAFAREARDEIPVVSKSRAQRERAGGFDK
jgi:hypothetical protein